VRNGLSNSEGQFKFLNLLAYKPQMLRGSGHRAEWMRLEVGRQFHLQSHYFPWVVLVLLPALIALHGYPEIKSRRLREFVGLAQWYLVAAGYVLTIVDPVIFADDRPDVLTCLITPSAPS
jgi:hypothetical protein